jgi:hypothetical protein
MWYILIVVFLLVSLFVGYKTTLSMDNYLSRKERHFDDE